MLKYFNKEESLSSEMIKEVESFLEGYGWDEDTFWEKTHPVFIKLKSGYSFSCIPSDYDSIAYDFDLEYILSMTRRREAIVQVQDVSHLAIRTIPKPDHY